MFHLGGSEGSNIKLGDEASGDLYRGSAGMPPPYSGSQKRTGAKTTITSSQLRKGSDGSGSTSEEYILQDMNGSDLRGIQVHRTVMQRRD